MSRFLNGKYSQLQPYVPGEQPQDRSYIKLNTNESPYPASDAVLEALCSAEISKLNLYSDPTADLLIKALAEEYGLAPGQVFAGNGSDEVLAFAFQAFCDEGKGMACPEIGYGFYPVFCSLLGIEFLPVALNDDFTIDISRFKGLTQNITIANPNAQTGLYMPISDIESLLCENPDRLIIIDEAYCGFGGASALHLLESYDNLVIVGTMSKSRQLAGARVGYAFASEAIIGDLNKIKYSFNPYNLNRLSILAGVAALKDKEYFQTTSRLIIETREYTKEKLKELGFEVTDSAANFVLASLKGISGKQLYQSLKQRGVLVRFLKDEKLKSWVRITIGSRAQMNTLLGLLMQIKEETGL